ncbi:MAG: hypothetical protein AB1752_11575 [Candidatus Zixiibacteriota bacterium]
MSSRRKVAVQADPARNDGLWLREAGVLVVLILIAWQFVRLRYRFNIELPLATLEDLAAGRAYRPFQFRLLVPLLASGLRSIGWGPLVYCYQTIDFAAVIGLYYSFRYFLSSYFQPGSSRILSFVVFYALVWNYLLAQDIPILLPYDLPGVAFFTLGLALLQRRRWAWFYPVFVVGCLNRETMIFLTLALVAVEFGRRPVKDWIAHAAVQAVIWIAVKAVVGYVYRGNPGSPFEFYHVGTRISHLQTNLEMFAHPMNLLLVLSNFGFAWVVMLVGRRRIASPFLRRALWIIPPFLLTLLLGTNINENRLYGELIPLVMTVSLLVVSHTLRALAPTTTPVSAPRTL